MEGEMLCHNFLETKAQIGFNHHEDYAESHTCIVYKMQNFKVQANYSITKFLRNWTAVGKLKEGSYFSFWYHSGKKKERLKIYDLFYIKNV